MVFKLKTLFWIQIALYAPGIIIIRVYFPTDLLSVSGSPSMTCVADVRPFLLPAGALLCLEFNGCLSAYRSQHPRGWRLRWDGWGMGYWRRLALL